MTIPTGEVLVPDVVRELAGDSRIVPAWTNELGGLTFRIEPVDGQASDGQVSDGGARTGADQRAFFVKWAPRSERATIERVDLADEANRMQWAAQYTPVPHVLEVGADADSEWLATEAIEIIEGVRTS